MQNGGLAYFTYFELLIGVYLLVCAVRGKGKLFENEHLKIPRERYVKVLRILAAVTGAVLAGANALMALGLVEETSALGWVLWALGFACIMAMAIFSAKSSNRGPATSGQAGPAKDPLRAAFVFDEEEEDGAGQ